MNQPKPSQKRSSSIGTGTISLLMIFTVLCFATLAMLSLSTAAANANIQQRGILRQTAISQAKGDTATEVAGLDAELLVLQQQHAGNFQSFFDEALQVAEARGWVADAATNRIVFRLPVEVPAEDGEETTVSFELVTTLELLPPGSTSRYNVVGQTTELVDGWQAEDGGQLWMPED